MPENDRLSGRLGEIDLEFVDREAPPRLVTRLGVHLRPATNDIRYLHASAVRWYTS